MTFKEADIVQFGELFLRLSLGEASYTAHIPQLVSDKRFQVLDELLQPPSKSVIIRSLRRGFEDSYNDFGGIAADLRTLIVEHSLKNGTSGTVGSHQPAQPSPPSIQIFWCSRSPASSSPSRSPSLAIIS